MNPWITYLAKSIYAALVAVSSTVIIALRNTEGTVDGGNITGNEWLVIILAGLVAGVGVFALPPQVDSPPEQRRKAAAAKAAQPPTVTEPNPLPPPED